MKRKQKRDEFKHMPLMLKEASPGTRVLTSLGVGGYDSRVQIAWHWKDGSVCVRPLQLAGGLEHVTLPGKQSCKRCDDLI